MIMVMVAVRDVKAEVFMRPWFVQSAGVAVRTFSDEVNRAAEDNTMYNHPDDFILYELGLYDDNSGKIQPHEVIKMLVTADTVKAKK